MSSSKWQSSTVPDLIIEVWELLDCESVGARELEEIQNALSEKFGPGAVKSPAAIARAVADEGAVLRHPEVFACDFTWRERSLAEQSFADQLRFSSLSEAVTSFGKLEEHRFQIGDDVEGIKRLRDVVKKTRQDVLLTAQSKVLGPLQREEAKEIAEWITVWLRSPALFPDWLDLRMRTTEFKGKFARGD